MSKALHFRSIDTNRSGAIEYAEFAAMMCKVGKRKPQNGIFGKLQLAGIIHEIAVNGPISVRVKDVAPLHRGTSYKFSVDVDDTDDNEFTNPDELTCSLPPEQSSCCSKLFCCWAHSARIAAISEQMFAASKNPVGPHGRYCMCGCRSFNNK